LEFFLQLLLMFADDDGVIQGTGTGS